LIRCVLCDRHSLRVAKLDTAFSLFIFTTRAPRKTLSCAQLSEAQWSSLLDAEFFSLEFLSTRSRDTTMDITIAGVGIWNPFQNSLYDDSARGCNTSFDRITFRMRPARAISLDNLEITPSSFFLVSLSILSILYRSTNYSHRKHYHLKGLQPVCVLYRFMF